MMGKTSEVLNVHGEQTLPGRDSTPVNCQGFTLLELLISLTIFALIAAMAYSGLNQVLTARDRSDEQASKLADVQRTFNYLERDIEQTVDRKIRDGYGDSQPALVGNITGDYLLELTHSGWRNPANNPRSNLQRVAYTVRDEKLIRAIWYMLDRAQDSKPYESELMSGVKAFEVRYMNKGHEWVTGWPDALLGEKPDLSPPLAVEVNIDTKAFGKITRLFRVPG
jgi:general secretion pathway protein J